MSETDPLITQSTYFPTKLCSHNLLQLSHLQQKANSKINSLVLVENLHGPLSFCLCSYIMNISMNRVIKCSLGEGETVLG